MKNKFALCFRPVVVETEAEKENRDCNRNIVDDHHHHLDEATLMISKGSKRSFSFSDVNRSSTQPNYTPRHDRLQRKNSSSRKTAGSISSAWKTLFRSSPKVVPKGSGDFGEENEHMGIKKNKGSKDTNSSKNQITYSKSSSSGSSGSSSSSTTSHVTSPSSSTSSSMNSSEMNHNMNEVSNLKRSMLARSNSTSNTTTNKKPKTTKARDNKALKSSKENNQEGFVFYLVILALVFNMLCGLVYAIVLTSLSLYFMGRHRSHQRPVNALKLAELRKSKRKNMLHV